MQKRHNNQEQSNKFSRRLSTGVANRRATTTTRIEREVSSNRGVLDRKMEIDDNMMGKETIINNNSNHHSRMDSKGANLLIKTCQHGVGRHRAETINRKTSHKDNGKTGPDSKMTVQMVAEAATNGVSAHPDSVER